MPKKAQVLDDDAPTRRYARQEARVASETIAANQETFVDTSQPRDSPFALRFSTENRLRRGASIDLATRLASRLTSESRGWISDANAGQDCGTDTAALGEAKIVATKTRFARQSKVRLPHLSEIGSARNETGPTFRRARLSRLRSWRRPSCAATSCPSSCSSSCSSGDCFGSRRLVAPALFAAMSISIFCACCFAKSSDAPPDFEKSSRSRFACVEVALLEVRLTALELRLVVIALALERLVERLDRFVRSCSCRRSPCRARTRCPRPRSNRARSRRPVTSP